MKSDFTNDQDEKTEFAKYLRALADQVESDKLPAMIVGILYEDGRMNAAAYFDSTKPLCQSCACDFVSEVADSIISHISEDPDAPTERCPIN